MYSMNTAKFVYEPYPVCYATKVFSESDYNSLSRSYPDISLFQHLPNLGDKYSLSERNNHKKYKDFLSQEPVWGRLHEFLKSESFIRDTLAFLKSANVDLGLDRCKYSNRSGTKKATLLSRLQGKTELSARFEFSAMGGNGGHILPHTDSANKLVTLVMSMNTPGEWNKTWGGGTEVCVPIDRTRIYNHVNRYLSFSDVEVIDAYDFVPNQCLLFIKTYNSWHQVSPIHTPHGSPLRKTLTINIEQLS